MRRRGFTLVELLVVLAMIAILMGSMGAAVVGAKRRAKLSKASQEVHEMTNAILAFEQFAKDRSLAGYVTGSWAGCSEGNMKMILGGETGENGRPVPVLFNAAITAGSICDPWGTPYQYKIENTATMEDGQGTGKDDTGFVTAPFVPNFFRLTVEERAL